jgi:hypothetical protein
MIICSNIATPILRWANSYAQLLSVSRRLASCLLLASTSAFAQGSEAGQPLPDLRPPRPEIPPGFWEQHAFLVVAAALFVLALAALAAWYLLRPRPVVPTPPEVLARKDLATMRQEREDAAALSRVSQILRRYVITAFGLSPGERTTADLAAALANDPRLGPGLVAALLEFLRACDERKFSPVPPQLALGAVDRALALIDRAEARRAALRQSESRP